MSKEEYLLSKVSEEIVDIFDKFLYSKEIQVPCRDEDDEKDRLANENKACIYGYEYWDLVEEVNEILEARVKIKNV